MSREGAASRTADNLASVFLDDVAALTTYEVPADIASIDASGWCADSRDSQALADEIIYAEHALAEAGLCVVWDDGYVIERVTEDEDLTDDLETMLGAYEVCALWSSSHYASENAEPVPMDDVASADDVADEARAEMRAECLDFLAFNYSDVLAMVATAGFDYASVGHDFWLTRNGHGAGFWDRGLGEIGERLSKAARVYGSSDLYIGDDGKVYVS